MTNINNINCEMLLSYSINIILLIPFYYVKGQLTQTEMNGTFFRMKIERQLSERCQNCNETKYCLCPEKPINAHEYVGFAWR
jgi:hypothetical protein